MRLVGVARLGRDGRQVTRTAVRVDPGDEPAETQHPLQCLGAVADRGVALCVSGGAVGAG